jgi:tetratricopeptide (TPR) repeat protein
MPARMLLISKGLEVPIAVTRKLRLVAAVTIAVDLLTSTGVQAGLYNTSEPLKGPRPAVAAKGIVEGLGFTQFRDLSTDLSNIGNPLRDSALRRHYLLQRDKLLEKARTGPLTTEEKVNLSEFLIRLWEFDKAIELLTPEANGGQRNFMVFANLGTAHQLAGQLERAQSYLQMAVDAPLQEWPGIGAAQLQWYRRVEKYHRSLVRARYRETLGSPQSRGKAPETLDGLFTSAQGTPRFVGDSGHYEVGKMSTKERAKLPDDALAIVQQLLLWIPGAAPGMEDPRLYWLLGELYNASGDTETAAQIFQTLVWSYRFDAPELREHRKMVQAAMPEPVSQAPAKTPAEPTAEKPSWLPNSTKIAIVGGIAALVIAGLVYMQLRELRRRRQNLG